MDRSLNSRTRFARFIAVGLLNSAIGYAALVSSLLCGAGDLAANAIGYFVGLLSSFVLNRTWTFQYREQVTLGQLSRYAGIFLLAYAANLIVLGTLRHAGFVDNPIAHIPAIAVYTVVFYWGATKLVFINSEDAHRELTIFPFLRRWWPELGIAILTAIAYLALYAVPLSHDVVWQMWIARQMLGGTVLYEGIKELNPPLWFWIAVPVEDIAQIVGVASSRGIVAFVFCCVAFALIAISRLFADQRADIRAGMLAVTFITLVLIPLSEFAQREHLALIGAVCYASLISRRVDGEHPNFWLAIGVGAIAALGFALKHYFVLIPLLLEVWLAARLTSKWRPWRPEVFVLTACGIAYTISVLVFAPTYLSEIVPLISAAYDGGNVGLVAMLKPTVVLWLAIIVYIVFCWRNAASVTRASVIVAGCFAIAYFLQMKGWLYHAMPVMGALFFAAGMLFVTWQPPNGFPFKRLILLSLLVPFAFMVSPHQDGNKAASEALAGVASRGDTVAMFTSKPSRIWPLMEDAGYKWPLRHFAFWMLSAIAKAADQPAPDEDGIAALKRQIWADTVDDIRCNPPKVILIDKAPISGRPFDMKAFLTQDPTLAELLSHYSEERTVSGITVLLKDVAWSPAQPSNCRAIR